MRRFDVRAIEIRPPRQPLFEFLRIPGKSAALGAGFVSAEHDRARLETPAGAVDIGLKVLTNADAGTVDWRLLFPEGGIGVAHSRVIETTRGSCIYSFVLHASGGTRADRRRT